MPYNKRKQKCKQSDGTPGNYVLSYTTKKGEKRRACHTSKKKMQGQIAAIEAEADESSEGQLAERVLRLIIREVLQSHTIEPVIGDYVVNVNPGCKHYGSEGVVVRMEELPEDSGVAACYKCTNSGVNWSEGDVLQKSLDQLELA
tara:strand:- start:3094 stop:3528 length:435 start_codon:yes stop_codon:yes gene_type:complete